jgi:hypothetical protein
VHVTAAGDAAWSVLLKGKLETTIIASIEERDTERRERLDRQSEEARVDWSVARDHRRPPALTYSHGAPGCHGAGVWAWSPDRTEALAIRDRQSQESPDRKSLVTPQTLNIAANANLLEVIVRVYERPLRDPFCNDVRNPLEAENQFEVWRAAQGTVSIELSPLRGQRGDAPRSRATIRIDGAELVNADGVRVRQARPIRFTAIVSAPNQ